MANWYVSSVEYAAVVQWSAVATLSIGTIRRQLTAPGAGDERCYRVSSISTGITGATEPAWPLTLNGTVVDGGVTWTECTGQEAYQTTSVWTAPAANFYVIANSTGRGNVLQTDYTFVRSNHTETYSVGFTYSRMGNAICVSTSTATLPPVGSDVSTGAKIATTGASGFTIAGTSYCYGITFSIGSGASAANFTCGTTATPGTNTFDRCFLELANTNAGSKFVIGYIGVTSSMILNNTPLKFGAAGQSVSQYLSGATFGWYNTPTNAIQGVSPSNLLSLPFGIVVMADIANVDLSALAGNILQTNAGSNSAQCFVFVNSCKLGPNTLLASNLRTYSSAFRLQMTNSSQSTVPHIAGQVTGRNNASGGIAGEFSIYRVGGAAAGAGSPYSVSIIASSTTTGDSPTYRSHPVTPLISYWNSTIGVPRTITVHGLANDSALFTSNDLWLAVDYLDSSTSVALNTAVGRPSPLNSPTPVSVTATTDDWSQGVGARPNSLALVEGQAVAVASNPKRVFFCTTAGVTAASEPAGYASAVDGSVITDGLAVVRAGFRFSVSLTVTPLQEGWINSYIHYMLSQSTVTLTYIDPTVVVT